MTPSRPGGGEVASANLGISGGRHRRGRPRRLLGVNKIGTGLPVRGLTCSTSTPGDLALVGKGIVRLRRSVDQAGRLDDGDEERHERSRCRARRNVGPTVSEARCRVAYIRDRQMSSGDAAARRDVLESGAAPPSRSSTPTPRPAGPGRRPSRPATTAGVVDIATLTGAVEALGDRVAGLIGSDDGWLDSWRLRRDLR